ncbi:bifunctional 4-hydroxy-2-oxoglutarate aldolase/2-dehydro-3-deoxy-phosphogluconate aldolase [Oculatella sp. LEGE 06141]|uniref:bifunctional 4-hydroxy-2-oxoglutarate aldolase/2-dehydro-3-deoxy-phosphogluconate aldolase n=1 Tax=Oculatella sp. LEGE 06141 TaxID=1828648 RepID=UPI001880B8AC|nr:bifunctional 4-hydroxy-2-oxoglutarate aldolase/2-dehydro-3-deoxy-phosphogluconate aldolase [Oculatella sp. LEGE 06141]
MSDKPVPKFSAAWLNMVRQQRAIAVIRADQMEQGRRMAQAVAAGGMRLIEITWNSDRAADLIRQLQQDLPDCTIGTGTLLTADDVQQAIAAGAQFLFSPHTDATLIQIAVTADVPMVPGALSPSEIVAAWQAGATAVKVFPVQAVGGAGYIQSLQGPLGSIPLIPTGGVTIDNTLDFLAAGAIAVGLSGQLFPTQAIATHNWALITNRAKTLMQYLQNSVPPI